MNLLKNSMASVNKKNVLRTCISTKAYLKFFIFDIFYKFLQLKLPVGNDFLKENKGMKSKNL